MNEKDFEDIVSKYPEIIEEGLELEARQLTILGRRIDLLFRDTFGRKLLIELKVGPIKDEHVGQILAYEGLILSADYPTLRIMLIANRVPPNIRRSLDHHGIAWREVSQLQLRDFLSAREDQILLRTLEDGKGIKTNDALRKRRSYPKDRQEKSVEISSYRTLSRLFGSRLRAKAIAWFFTHNKEAFFVRQVAGVLNEDATNVSRELINLEQLKILVSYRHANLKHFQLNPECPILNELRGIASKLLVTYGQSNSDQFKEKEW